MPLTTLSSLDLQGCIGLKALPNLEMFPALPLLDLCGCPRLAQLTNIVALTALSQLTLQGYVGLEALADLGMFSTLPELELYNIVD